MNDIDQSLKGDDLIDNQVVEFAERVANQRINALTESLNDLRRSYNELQVEHDEYVRDTEELLEEAITKRNSADIFKGKLMALVGITMPLSDDDVVDLLKHVLTVAARLYRSRVSVTDTVDALSEVREEMLLDGDAKPNEVSTSVRQYVNLNNHLLDVVDEVLKLDLEESTPEEALAERVRNLREMADSAKYSDRLNDLFDAAIESVAQSTVEEFVSGEEDDAATGLSSEDKCEGKHAED